MRRLPKIQLAAALLFLATAVCGGVIELRCVSDLHGNALRFARMRKALEPENPEIIRIDAGDTMQGTFNAEFTRGATMIALLNRYNFDIWTPGNHDFEFGFGPLADAEKIFRGHTLGAEWSWFALRPEPWTLLKRGDFTVAVIGLTDPAMPRRMLPGDGAKFEPPAGALRRLMPEIRRADPDLVVLVWHNGLYSSIGSMGKFLREFPEIDLVVGAHSHEEHPGESIGNAWFVQAGSHARAVVAVRAEIDDRTRRVTRITSKLLRPEPRASEEDFAFVTSAERDAMSFGKIELGRMEPPLQRPVGKAFNSPSGRILAEAIRRKTGSDIGFSKLASDGFVLKNPVTMHNLFGFIPYENRLCRVRISSAGFDAFVAEQRADSRKGRYSPALTATPADKTEFTLGLSAFALTGSRVLLDLIAKVPERLEKFEFTERSAMADFIQKRGK